MSNLLWRKSSDLEQWGTRSPFQTLVDEFFGDNHFHTSEFTPKMNVSETEKEYKVTAELPGLEEKDFEVVIENDVLRIKGEKKHQSEDKNENFYRFESSYGSFERALRLPEIINSGATKAKFKNGVLTIIIPKDQQASRTHKVQIESESTKN